MRSPLKSSRAYYLEQLDYFIQCNYDTIQEGMEAYGVDAPLDIDSLLLCCVAYGPDGFMDDLYESTYDKPGAVADTVEGYNKFFDCAAQILVDTAPIDPKNKMIGGYHHHHVYIGIGTLILVTIIVVLLLRKRK